MKFRKFIEVMETEAFSFTINNVRIFVRVWGLVLIAFTLGLILG